MTSTETSPPLAQALRATAERLRSGVRYEWGHVGRCNCGHLVQSLTDLDDRAIYRSFRHELAEWSELAEDYCPATGGEVDGLFRTLFAQGMSLRDVAHLENLSDPEVLRRLPVERRHELRRHVRQDAVDYMEAYADLLDRRAAVQLRSERLGAEPLSIG